MRRKPEPVDWYLTLIAQTWPDFVDDGLSFFPDWLYARWNLGLAGTVHDWHFCTRCHKAGSMTRQAEKFSNRALRQHANELLPWFIPVVPFILYYGTSIGAHYAWDTCGPEAGERCRHNILQPVWMQTLGGM